MGCAFSSRRALPAAPPQLDQHAQAEHQQQHTLRVCIVGGGWYGCHVACVLAKDGHAVTLMERHADLFLEASSGSSFRLHNGPHYPRSPDTRAQCKKGFRQFVQQYPELVQYQTKAIYAIGSVDSTGNPSCVDWEDFKQVCLECDTNAKEVDKSQFACIEGAMDVEEATIYVDEPRFFFEKKMRELGVQIRFSHDVVEVKGEGGQETEARVVFRALARGDKLTEESFDWAINCTYFQGFTKTSEAPMDYFYQPCITLVYRSSETPEKLPFSFTVMDGSFPSIDPYEFKRPQDQGFPIMTNYTLPVSIDPKKERLYIVTHAEFTHTTSTPDYVVAKGLLRDLTAKRQFVEDMVRPKIEESIARYFPAFAEQFHYLDFFVSMKTKILSRTEFRGAYVWKEPAKRLLHVFSGKIDTIFEAGDQVRELLLQRGLAFADVTAEGHGKEDDGSTVVPKSFAGSEALSTNMSMYRRSDSKDHATLYTWERCRSGEKDDEELSEKGGQRGETERVLGA